MIVLLDTHTWIWWVGAPERLSTPAREAISSAESVRISTLSCWEVPMLVERGRLSFDRPMGQWVREALRTDGRTSESRPDAEVAITAAQLGTAGFHGDPADRFIYATARRDGALLVTKDAEMRRFDEANTCW